MKTHIKSQGSHLESYKNNITSYEDDKRSYDSGHLKSGTWMGSSSQHAWNNNPGWRHFRAMHGGILGTRAWMETV